MTSQSSSWGKKYNIPEDYELVCFLPIGIALQPIILADKKS